MSPVLHVSQHNLLLIATLTTVEINLTPPWVESSLYYTITMAAFRPTCSLCEVEFDEHLEHVVLRKRYEPIGFLSLIAREWMVKPGHRNQRT